MTSHPLYEYRQQHGLSLDALGMLLGVKKPYLSKIERGLQRPPVERAIAWEAAIGVSWQEIMTWGLTMPRSRVKSKEVV